MKRMDSEHLDGQLLHEEDVVAIDGCPAKLRTGGLLDLGFDGAKLSLHKQDSMGFLVMRHWDVPLEVRNKKLHSLLLLHYILMIPRKEDFRIFSSHLSSRR